MKLTCSIIKCALALLLFSTFLSCSKEEQNIKSAFLDCDKGMTNNIDTVKTHIAGKYDWVRTWVASRSDSYYITPETRNLTFSYVFKENFDLDIYENGVIKEECIYEVRDLTFYGNFTEPNSEVHIFDRKSKILKDIFPAYICNDSARFNFSGSFSVQVYLTRNRL